MPVTPQHCQASRNLRFATACNANADQGRHPQPEGGSNWEGDADSEAWAADLRLLDGLADMGNQIHACQAAACALWALCRHWHHPQVRAHKDDPSYGT
jgi:hypothetical protein